MVHDGTRTSPTAKPTSNPADAGPIVRRPMGLPVAAGCDRAWTRTRISSGTASNAMQCLRPLGHSGGHREILDENLLQSAQDLRLGRRFTFQQNNDPKHTAKTKQEWLWVTQVSECPWVTQPEPGLEPDLTSLERLENNCAATLPPSNLTALERICREEWEKLPKYRGAKLIASYPRRFEAVISDKGASTKYWVKGLNIYVNVIFPVLKNI